MNTHPTPDTLLSKAKLARMLGIDPTTIDKLLTPSIVTPAGRKLYRWGSVHEQLTGGTPPLDAA